MSNQAYVDGYCLRNRSIMKISYPEGCDWCLYTCPLCGEITEQIRDSWHLLQPSKPLLDRLLAEDKVVAL